MPPECPPLTSDAELCTLAKAGRDHRDWYQFAHAQVVAGATILEIPPDRFADLLAIFSPRVSVVRSIRFAVHYVWFGAFLPDVTRNVRTAITHYEQTGEIRGPKTAPFARALRGDCDAIVIDSWMAEAFNVPVTKVRSRYVLGPCEDAIRRVAKRLKWTPAQAQAAIWAGIVRKHGRTVPELFIAPELDGVPI